MPNEGPAHNIVPTRDERKLFIVMCVTAGVMLLEVVGGYLSGSLALLADAGHMFTDVAGLSMSWFALRLGRRAPDSQRTYGYQRFKILAAYTNGVLLFFLCFVIASEALDRLSNPREVNGPMMLAIAIIGLITNIAGYLILKGKGSHLFDFFNHHGHDHGHGHGDHDHHHHTHSLEKSDLNIQSAALHVLSDLLGSVGTILAGIIIMLTGWQLADPLLSLVIAVLIFFYALGLVKRTVHILVEGAPDGDLPEKMRVALMANIKGLVDVHHIHVWSLTEKQPLATLHVTIDENTDSQAALCDIRDFLEKKFDLDHATIQIEKGPCGNFDI
jgi:cobalt-zinc-cadmium efflux system protein